MSEETLRAALRRFAIITHERLAEGGRFVETGKSCAVCKVEWERGAPEKHQPGCPAEIVVADLRGATVIVNDLGPRRDESYIGDGVYVSHDDFQLWLKVADGVERSIALDPSVYQELIRYAKRIGFHN